MSEFWLGIAVGAAVSLIVGIVASIIANLFTPKVQNLIALRSSFARQRRLRQIEEDKIHLKKVIRTDVDRQLFLEWMENEIDEERQPIVLIFVCLAQIAVIVIGLGRSGKFQYLSGAPEWIKAALVFIPLALVAIAAIYGLRWLAKRSYMKRLKILLTELTNPDGGGRQP